MKKYIAPEMEMIVLQSADSITNFSSGDYATQQDELNFSEFFGS